MGIPPACRKLILLGYSGTLSLLPFEFLRVTLSRAESNGSEGGRIPFFTRRLQRPCPEGSGRGSRVTKLCYVSVFLILLLVTSYSPLAPAAYAGDSLYFIHTDHLGSTVAVTDEDGEIVSQNRHFPYGEDRLPAVSGQLSATERNYTSQIKDNETSLYYYNARYYDPALGTFVSADPVGDGFNRFGYVHGNPLAYVDPSGGQTGVVGSSYTLPGIVATGVYVGTATSKMSPLGYVSGSLPSLEERYGVNLESAMGGSWSLDKKLQLSGTLVQLPPSLTKGVAIYDDLLHKSSAAAATYPDRGRTIALSSSFLHRATAGLPARGDPQRWMVPPKGVSTFDWRVTHELLHVLQHSGGDVFVSPPAHLPNPSAVAESPEFGVDRNLAEFANVAEGVSLGWELTTASNGCQYYIPTGFEITDRDYWSARVGSYAMTGVSDLYAELGTEFVWSDTETFVGKYGQDMYDYWQSMIYPAE